METEALKNEVNLVIVALEAIATAPHPLLGFGDGYKQIGVNFSLEACKIAAKITGADEFFCKMLNHKFRTDACELMFERALTDIAA